MQAFRPFRPRLWIALLMLSEAVMGTTALAAPHEAVDLELVIATDNSGSIDRDEARLQRDGVASAFRSSEIVYAIEMGALGKIAVAYLDWSNSFDNRVVIDWTVIHDSESADLFSDMLMRAPPSYGRRTSISGAIVSGMQLIEGNRFDGTRRVIDISGDGPNNYGMELAPVRNEAVAKGIVINGLPILSENSGFSARYQTPDIEAYYIACVIGGAGSFAIAARGFEDFALAIRHKLILEISHLAPPPLLPDESRLVVPARAAPEAGRGAHSPSEHSHHCDQWAFGASGIGRF